MAVSTSYRLDPELKQRLAARATQEGITETALVCRLLDEGLKMATHPGVVYREGPAGRRAVVAGGPDVWEAISGVRHARGEGEARIADAAEQMGISDRLVRIAVNFAADYPGEIEQRLALNEAAAERARHIAEQRARVLAS